MLRAGFASIGQKLNRACAGHQSLPAFANSVLGNNTTTCSSCSCGTQQICMIHGSATAFANPDNKPAPAGKDPKDPRNVKEDTPTRDPDDSPDYAPGYYDGKGGGHRRVASQNEAKQVPDRKPGGEPKDWHPEEAEDPNLPGKEDPNKAKIPDMNSVDSSADRANPNQDPPVGDDPQVGRSQMPDQETKLAGMPEATAPPQNPSTPNAPQELQGGSTDSSSPFGDPAELDDFKRPGAEIAQEGKVRPGAPDSEPGSTEVRVSGN